MREERIEEMNEHPQSTHRAKQRKLAQVKDELRELLGPESSYFGQIEEVLNLSSVDPYEKLTGNLHELQQSIDALKSILSVGRNLNDDLKYVTYFQAFHNFKQAHIELVGNVENFVNPLLLEVLESMFENLADYGDFGENFFNADPNRLRLDELLGPNGLAILNDFETLKPIRSTKGNVRRRPDTPETLKHLKTVLMLDVIRMMMGDDTPFPLNQMTMGDLTRTSQAKISLDLWTARQILLEKWILERINGTPHIELAQTNSQNPFGPFGVELTSNGKPIASKDRPNLGNLNTQLTLNDNYDRWPRYGFGYIVIQNANTRKAAIVTLHLADGHHNASVQIEIEHISQCLRTYPPNQISEHFDTAQLRSIPIGHFIATSGGYHTARFFTTSNLDKLATNSETDSIEDLFQRA
mgnify:CR=1 FL=1